MLSFTYYTSSLKGFFLTRLWSKVFLCNYLPNSFKGVRDRNFIYTDFLGDFVLDYSGITKQVI